MLTRAREIFARNDEIHMGEASRQEARRTQELNLPFEEVDLSDCPDEQALRRNAQSPAKCCGVEASRRFVKTPEINTVRNNADFVVGKDALALKCARDRVRHGDHARDV